MALRRFSSPLEAQTSDIDTETHGQGRNATDVVAVDIVEKSSGVSAEGASEGRGAEAQCLPGDVESRPSTSTAQ